MIVVPPGNFVFKFVAPLPYFNFISSFLFSLFDQVFALVPVSIVFIYGTFVVFSLHILYSIDFGNLSKRSEKLERGKVVKKNNNNIKRRIVGDG